MKDKEESKYALWDFRLIYAKNIGKTKSRGANTFIVLFINVIRQTKEEENKEGLQNTYLKKKRRTAPLPS